ncbi:MAG: 3-phosphoshikimate 1-carboxyvinyltransferase [Planctomycetota bacterium]
MKIINKIRNFDVKLTAPPAKAYTLRALIISSLAEGKSIIHCPLLGQDQLNVIKCLESLGAKIELPNDSLVVEGCGGKYAPAVEELDVCESGVGMNFLTSAACLCSKPVVITGSKRITERPISEVVSGLRQLGCRIEYLGNEGFPPVKVFGGGIRGGKASIHGQMSSQYFSSIVISSPYAQSPVTLQCLDNMTEKPYLDISLQMMSRYGVEVQNNNYKEIRIPVGKYHPQEMTIEGDYSSASFFFLAAAVTGGKVTLTGLRRDTKQGDRAFLDLLSKMGCEISQTTEDVSVQGRALAAIEEDMGDIPDLLPPIGIAAAFAKGTSRFTNIGHLRHKESDRPAVMASQLKRMGVAACCEEGTLTVTGTKKIYGGVINPHNDHRIAMSFAAAGLMVSGTAIENEMCVTKSFPDFWERFRVFTEQEIS